VFAIRERITHLLLVLVLLALIGVMAMLATDARGGPLDPAGPPASTSSVRLPGTPIDPPSNPASYPIVIASSGHYYLTGNLNPPVDTRAITISASDVSLDLGGFTVSGSGPGTAVGVLVFGAQQRIQIGNGTVRGFPSAGIQAAGATRVLIHDVTAVENETGIYVTSEAVVRDCNASSNSDSGILISGSRSRIDGCLVASNAFVGISLQNGSGVVVQGSQIENNNTSGVSVGGILLNSMDGATIRDNDFFGNLLRDAHLNFTSDNNIFINNTFTCPATHINEGANNFIPMNTADAGTNRAHLSGAAPECSGGGQ